MTPFDLLKYADYFVFLPAISRLPIRLAYRLADWRGSLQSIMRKDSRRNAEANLAKVFPSWSRARIRKITLQGFQVKARDELEAFWYSRPLRFFEKFVDIRGLEELRKALAPGKGVLFFSGHFGSLGLCWSMVGKHGMGMTIVARSIEPEENPLHPAAQRYNRKKVAWIEENIGNRFLLTRRGNFTLMQEMLRRGEIVMIAIDVLPNILNLRRTVVIEFLEEPAVFADGIANLYRTSEARLVQWTIHREAGSGRQKIELRDVTDQVDRTGTNTEIIQTLAGLLEEKIRLHPDHWHVWDSVGVYRDHVAEVKRLRRDGTG